MQARQASWSEVDEWSPTGSALGYTTARALLATLAGPVLLVGNRNGSDGDCNSGGDRLLLGGGYLSSGGGYLSSVFGDWNGDTRGDVVMVLANGTLVAAVDNGSSVFVSAPIRAAGISVAGYNSVVAVDVNCDGITDVVAAGGSGVVAMVNSHTQVWSGAMVTASSALYATPVDVNRDGTPDLFVTTTIGCEL